MPFVQAIRCLYSVERNVLVLRPRPEPLFRLLFQRSQLAKTAGSADRGLEGGRVTEVFGIIQISVLLT